MRKIAFGGVKGHRVSLRRQLLFEHDLSGYIGYKPYSSNMDCAVWHCWVRWSNHHIYRGYIDLIV